MAIRLVILDGDGVVWDHPDLSALTPPFRRLGPDRLVDSEGRGASLTQGIRKLLKGLAERGVIIALASWNRPEPVREALQQFGIQPYFRVVAAEPHPDKHRMIERILRRLMEEGVEVAPHQILYVDDRRIHLGEIRRAIGRVHFLQMHVDVKDPAEILEYVDRLADQP